MILASSKRKWSAVFLGCALASSTSAWACSATSRRVGFDDPLGDAGSVVLEEAGEIALDGGGSDAPRAPSEVFGHSASVLYRLDPTSKSVSAVGTMAGCSNFMIDIALDASGTLYGVSPDRLYTIDKSTAQCTEIGRGGFPNSLSFVPAGTLLPNEEALVGFDGSNYVQVDLATKSTRVVKALALGTKYRSSGDIVAVKGGPTYLTVAAADCQGDSACARCEVQDCLVEIDPKTGVLLRNYGPVGYDNVYGIGFWAGAVYGFSEGGALFQIDINGGTLKTTDLVIPNRPNNLSFNGAGSSTSAPPKPVN